MVSLRDLFTKDVKPFKTVPLRRPGLSIGLCYSIAVCSSLLIYNILYDFGVTQKATTPFFLPPVLTFIIYQQWLSYAKSIKAKKEKKPKPPRSS